VISPVPLWRRESRRDNLAIVLSSMLLLFFLVAVSGRERVGALLFQSVATTEQVAGTLTSLQDAHVGHVALCQTRALPETTKYLEDWARKTGTGSVAYVGCRNACLSQYRQSGLVPSSGLLLLVEWNMRIHVQAGLRWRLPPDESVLYGLVPDQNGVLFDWTPLLMRVEARCGYLGRFLCVDNSYAHSHLLRVRFELDVDPWERELIEGAATIAPFALITNVTVTRQPPWGPGQGDDEELLPPQDRTFAYAWHWLARSQETRELWEEAHKSYLQGIELLQGDPGIHWYALYRAGTTVLSAGGGVDEAARYLLLAYDAEPRRREPLAALTQAYRKAGRFALCRLYGMVALSIPFPIAPAMGPHVEVHVYEWSVADETALCLMELREYDQATTLMQHVLQRPAHSTLPVAERERMQHNVEWCRAQKERGGTESK
jgi:hypothetical protein